MSTPLPQELRPHTRQAVTLSVSEIALGSIVHGLHLPFGGHLLSLNEGVILSWTLRTCGSRAEGIRAVCGVANSAAILKALSPMGNRLAPMLAISIQGLLYALGVAVFGVSLAGSVVGLMLLSLWGFIQPLVVAALLYGKPFFQGILKVWSEIAHALGLPTEILWPVLAGVMGLKLVLAVASAVIVWRSAPEAEAAYIARLEKLATQTLRPKSEAKPQSPIRAAFRDLLSPPFLLGAALSLGFFISSGAEGAPAVAFYALRIFAGGLLLFWGMRALPHSWTARFRESFPQFQAVAARVATLRK
jgi:hypothetical protein